MTEKEIDEKLKKLDAVGLTVSIAHGTPSVGGGYCYSVTALHRETLDYFEKPFAVSSLSHAIEVARLEAVERGWIE